MPLSMTKLVSISLAAKVTLLNFPDPGASFDWSEDELANMDLLDQHDLEECVLEATVRGHLRLARALIHRRGPVRIVVAEHPKVPGRFTLNGRDMVSQIDERMFATAIRSPAQLKSLLAMIVKFDMKGLVEPGASFPLLMKQLHSNSMLMRFNVSEFKGALPELSDGVLKQPELAVALVGESGRTSTPGAYKPMLCWASEDMVRQFPNNLMRLKHFQDVRPHGSLAQWKAASGQPGNMDFTVIEVGLEPVKPSAAMVFRHLHFTMTPMSSRLGFADEAGRVLCVTTSDFLTQFPTQDCAEGNLQAAYEFVESYCPIEIMASQAAEVCREQFGRVEPSASVPIGYMNAMDGNFNDLFETLQQGHPLRERAIGVMTRDQRAGLFLKAEAIDAQSLLGVYQAFGIDNTGKDLHFFPHAFATLAKGGFEFSANTKIFTDSNKMQKHKQAADLSLEPAVLLPYDNTCFGEYSGVGSITRELFANCLKVKLWPIPGEPPADVAQALKDSSKLSLEVLSTPKKLAMYTYLQSAGVESCAQVASTPSQWMAMAQIFSSDELKPYLQVMPKQARGKVLETSLGL
jgi:hypothetical protein